MEKMTTNMIAEHATREAAELRKNARRYEWLRDRVLAADFDYEGAQVLVFEMPTGFTASADCDATIDAAMAACRGDDARLDEADAEIAELRGQAVVLRRLLADALAVMGTVEPDDTDEAERLENLCAAVTLALQPKREGTLL